MTPSPGIEPGPHWWKASDLPLRMLPYYITITIFFPALPSKMYGTELRYNEPTVEALYYGHQRDRNKCPHYRGVRFREVGFIWISVIQRPSELSVKADLDGTTFAYGCLMRFLERVLLASCKKSHTTFVIQHCLYLRLS